MMGLLCGVLGIESIGPFVNDWIAIDVIKVGHDESSQTPTNAAKSRHTYHILRLNGNPPQSIGFNESMY